MKRTIPEYRGVWTLPTASLWRDRRDGASAVIYNTMDGLTREELAYIFKAARQAGFEITPKRPLIVYGTICPLGYVLDRASFRRLLHGQRVA